MSDRETPIRVRVDASGLAPFLAEIAAIHTKDQLTFLCIGTDRSTGDSLGPWVGTLLIEQGFTRVIGTLEFPCDADHLPKLVPKLAEMGTIIAIDACLGRPENVGAYFVRNGPIVPAQSVGKSFGAIGSYSIAGIVNAISPKPYWTLQSTSLYRVMGMAKEISDLISKQWRQSLNVGERKGGTKQMKKRTLQGGLEMAYVEEGKGEPIILLHGYCGNHHYWDDVTPALSKHGRVIAIDQRGHGATSKSEGKYAMEQLAEDIAALMDELEISQVNLFGHSLGGYVALAFAERYPERLLTLGLLHSTSLPDDEAAQANRQKAVVSIQEKGVNPFVDGLIPKLFAATNQVKSPEKLQKATEIGYETSAEGAIGCALGMKERPARTSILEQLNLPILLLAGELDEIIPQAKRFPVSRDNITALTLSGVAHMGMMEDSEAFSSAIVTFLEQNRGV